MLNSSSLLKQAFIHSGSRFKFYQLPVKRPTPATAPLAVAMSHAAAALPVPTRPSQDISAVPACVTANMTTQAVVLAQGAATDSLRMPVAALLRVTGSSSSRHRQTVAVPVAA